MNMPGFNAEDSLYQSSSTYSATSVGMAGAASGPVRLALMIAIGVDDKDCSHCNHLPEPFKGFCNHCCKNPNDEGCQIDDDGEVTLGLGRATRFVTLW
jgi:hypothetical protein